MCLGLSGHFLSCIKLSFGHYRFIPLRHIEEGNLVFELERLGEPVAGCEVLGQDPGSPGQEAGPGPEGAAGEDEVVTQRQQRQVHTRRHGGAQPGRAWTQNTDITSGHTLYTPRRVH